MPTPETLSDAEDAFGRQLLDELAGIAGEGQLERDDGSAGPSMAASSFLTAFDEWHPAERLLPVSEVDERVGTFDSVLMMCGNFGLAGSAGQTVR